MRTCTADILKSLSSCCHEAQQGALVAARGRRSGMTRGQSKALTTSIAKILVLANGLASAGSIDADAFFRETRRLQADRTWLRRRAVAQHGRRAQA
ncbi:hypothetical protein QE368_000924 [Asaia bogorensis NBRC 16594]|nr:hypothetical protein [Asaia bogorensis NBRC 16594]